MPHRRCTWFTSFAIAAHVHGAHRSYSVIIIPPTRPDPATYLQAYEASVVGNDDPSRQRKRTRDQDIAIGFCIEVRNRQLQLQKVQKAQQATSVSRHSRRLTGGICLLSFNTAKKNRIQRVDMKAQGTLSEVLLCFTPPWPSCQGTMKRLTIRRKMTCSEEEHLVAAELPRRI